MNNKYTKALKAAFPLTLPICAAFLFLGISYGFYICSKGFSPWYPFFTSALVFAGSMEFVLVTMLLSPFNPLYCFFMALMINSRHLFYGLSMLEKYKNTGLKKFYLIFGMCDESFAINCNTVIPEGIDKGCFMVCVNLLNQIYWVAGATIGGLLGNSLQINTKGLDFALVALFTAIFVSQWQSTENHTPAILGIIIPLLCLVLIGPQSFIPPAMLLLLLVFITAYYKGGIKLCMMLAQACTLKEALGVLEEGMKGTLSDYTVASIAETMLMDVFPFGADSIPSAPKTGEELIAEQKKAAENK